MLNIRIAINLVTSVTPLQFVYFCLYTLFIWMCLSSTEFIPFWSYIELSIFIFMVLAFSNAHTSSYPSLCVYYIIQALSSLSMLSFYCVMQWYNLNFVVVLIYISLFINVGLFPFNHWYFSAVSTLPSFPFFISLTLQNLPPVYLFVGFILSSHSSTESSSWVLIISLFITLAVSVPMLLKINWGCLKSVLVLSSIFNGVWLIICGIVSLSAVYLFLIFYMFSVYLVLYSDNMDLLAIYNLIGLPPFPMFFLNLFVIYIILLGVAGGISILNLLLFALLLANSLFLALYFVYLANFITLNSGSVNSIICRQ